MTTERWGIAFENLPVEVLTFYKKLRRWGMTRRDANLVVMGVVIGTDAGNLRTSRWEAEES